MQSLGDRIRQAIKQSNYTQKQIASLIGLSENSLVNYIKSKRIPDAITVTKIAQLCDVSVSWLLTGKGDMKREDSAEAGQTVNDIVEDLKAGKITVEYAKARIEALKEKHQKELEKINLVLATIDSIKP